MYVWARLVVTVKAGVPPAAGATRQSRAGYMVLVERLPCEIERRRRKTDRTNRSAVGSGDPVASRPGRRPNPGQKLGFSPDQNARSSGPALPERWIWRGARAAFKLARCRLSEVRALLQLRQIGLAEIEVGFTPRLELVARDQAPLAAVSPASPRAKRAGRQKKARKAPAGKLARRLAAWGSYPPGCKQGTADSGCDAPGAESHRAHWLSPKAARAAARETYALLCANRTVNWVSRQLGRKRKIGHPRGESSQGVWTPGKSRERAAWCASPSLVSPVRQLRRADFRKCCCPPGRILPTNPTATNPTT